MYTRDWCSALRTPPTYRIGNRTSRFNYHFGLLACCVILLCFLFAYVHTGSQSSSDIAWRKSSSSSTRSTAAVSITRNPDYLAYDKKYPLTPPIEVHSSELTYRMGIVADLGTSSKVVGKDGSTVWRSYLKKGYLTYRKSKPEITVNGNGGDPVKLESAFLLNGRGMELSELVTFNGKQRTIDDHTGGILVSTSKEMTPRIQRPHMDIQVSKCIPNTDDKIIVAIKSEEVEGKTTTFINAFDIEGHTILPEQRIDADSKYEGFEFR
ncbi:soluble calcium-activated nucleotidase 1-like [Eurosta solidaginis]|uniref:soluble calcium-activated nucleotidase 1-like n=1 Tax=Eurosta solidaginis TaxID=178769 RepID=UPI003530B934